MPLVTRRTAIAAAGSGIFVAGGAALILRPGPAIARSPRPDLYNCEGCEAVAEAPRGALPATLRLVSALDPGEPMLLSGRVLMPDGMTPAAGVTIYAHHTNADGLYANGSPETQWSRRHGRLRGWVQTGADGRYAFETIKPAPYPDRSMPAHVHLFIGEPGRRPYYIDDVVFAGEFRVDADYLRRQELRGGSGVVALRRTAGGGWLAHRDIVLEPHPA